MTSKIKKEKILVDSEKKKRRGSVKSRKKRKKKGHKAPVKKFRIRSKSLYLTYSQIPDLPLSEVDYEQLILQSIKTKVTESIDSRTEPFKLVYIFYSTLGVLRLESCVIIKNFFLMVTRFHRKV